MLDDGVEGSCARLTRFETSPRRAARDLVPSPLGLDSSQRRLTARQPHTGYMALESSRSLQADSSKSEDWRRRCCARGFTIVLAGCCRPLKQPMSILRIQEPAVLAAVPGCALPNIACRTGLFVRSLARSRAASRSSAQRRHATPSRRLKTLAPPTRGGLMVRNTFRRCRNVQADSELSFSATPVNQSTQSFAKVDPVSSQKSGPTLHFDITSSRTPVSLSQPTAAERSQATLRPSSVRHPRIETSTRMSTLDESANWRIGEPLESLGTSL